VGLLVDGQWRDQWYDTKSTGGRFKRDTSRFRSWITPDGEAGPTGASGFKAEADRYHLYVSYACPWAHRTLIFRKLKGLEDMIPISVVHWYMAERGWTFMDGDGVVAEGLHRPGDRARALGQTEEHDRQQRVREIDEINARVYSTVNNGVYKSGFATTQEAYEEAVEPLFESLEWLDDRLSTRRYLMGDRITETDWRLFTTLLRFDPVYVGHFKCNRRRIVDFEHLWPYVRDLYQVPGVAETVHMDHIKAHYYMSHETINPTRIVPVGPDIDYSVPHDREALSG
jgi:putative glutathione S-transferase